MQDCPTLTVETHLAHVHNNKLEVTGRNQNNAQNTAKVQIRAKIYFLEVRIVLAQDVDTTYCLPHRLRQQRERVCLYR